MNDTHSPNQTFSPFLSSNLSYSNKPQANHIPKSSPINMVLSERTPLYLSDSHEALQNVYSTRSSTSCKGSKGQQDEIFSDFGSRKSKIFQKSFDQVSNHSPVTKDKDPKFFRPTIEEIVDGAVPKHPVENTVALQQSSVALQIQDQSPNIVNQAENANPHTLRFFKETDPSIRHFYRPEVRIYLAKVMGLFLTIMLFSLTLLLKIKYGIMLEFALIVPLSYLIYLIILDLVCSRKLPGNIWMKSDHKLQISDTLACIWALLWLYLRLIDSISSSVLACMVFVLTLFFHLMFSRAPALTKLAGIGLRALYIFQTLAISSKLDAYQDLRWEIIFIFVWIYLATRIYLWFKFGFCLLSLGKPVLSQHDQEQGLQKNLKMMGFAWFFFYYGMSFLLIAVLLQVGEIDQDPPNYEQLTNIGYMSFGISFCLLFSTFLIRKQLAEFIATFGLIESLWVTYEVAIAKKKANAEKFQIEKREAYFIMLTPTYFQLQHKISFSESRDGPEKIRGFIRNLKIRSSRITGALHSEKIISRAASSKGLKKFKEKLDKKLKAIKKAKKSLKGVMLQVLPKSLTEFESPHNNTDLSDIKPALKVSVSLDDLNRYKEQGTANIFQKSIQEEDPLCYVCYNNPPNAVFDDCGHGGLCYDCAITSLQEKNECTECRKTVGGIYKIEVNAKIPGIFKAIEFNKIESK